MKSKKALFLFLVIFLTTAVLWFGGQQTLTDTITELDSTGSFQGEFSDIASVDASLPGHFDGEGSEKPEFIQSSESKPGPRQPPVGKTLALTDSDAWRTTVKSVLFEKTERPDREGYFQRKRVVETDMPHIPYVRVVEKLRLDSETGEEHLVNRLSMVADHVLLQTREGVSQADLDNMLSFEGWQVRRQVREDGLFLVEFPMTGVDDVDLVTARLSKAGNLFQYAEPDYVVAPTSLPNDPMFADETLWPLRNTGQRQGRQGADIDAVRGWTIRREAPGVVVAVIDTGTRYTHRDLAANMWVNPRESRNGRDDSGSGYIDDIHGVNVINGESPWDLDGHGTHVAGTIGAVGNNGEGITGVAWNVQLMAIKFLDPFGTLEGAILSIDYATENGAHVLNNSWGGGGFSAALSDAILRARQAGLVFVASAGNASADNDAVRRYPSGFGLDNIVTVASTNIHGELSNFSNFGRNRVHIMAPGGTGRFDVPESHQIWSAWHTSDTAYNGISGTSMAAPHVSGVFALVKAQFPQDDHQQLINRVLSGANMNPDLADRVQRGRQLNLFRALGGGGAPLLTSAPKDAVFYTGGEAILKVEVSGKPPFTYQWFKDHAKLDGATGPELRLEDMTAADAGTYRVEVSNSLGLVSAEAEAIHLLDDPAIGQTLGSPSLVWITTPEAPWEIDADNDAVRSASIGHNHSSEVRTVVTGPGVLTFSWRVSSEKTYDTGRFFLNSQIRETISGESGWLNRTYQIPEGTHDLIWKYSKDGSRSEGADALWLRNVSYASHFPVLRDHTRSAELLEGATLTLQMDVSGAGPLVYFWTKDGNLIAGATGPSLPLPNVDENAAGTYVGVASNSHGSVSTRPIIITVVEEASPPEFTLHPMSVEIFEGERLHLRAAWEGTYPLTAQWLKNGSPIEGVTGPSLDLGRASEEDSGNYQVVVSNAAGFAESMVASVTVHPPLETFPSWMSRRGGSSGGSVSSVFEFQIFAFGESSPGSGIPNAPDFALLSLDPISPFEGEKSSGGEVYPSMDFQRPVNSAGVVYLLEVSVDLLNWEVVPSVIESLGPTEGQLRNKRIRALQPLESGAKRAFYRLRAESEN